MKSASALYYEKIMFEVIKRRRKMKEQKLENEYYILSKRQKRSLKFKNIADVILGCVGVIVLSPVFLAIAVAIKLEDGIKAPVFFKQKRVGINKTYFQLYKFRSMKLDTPHDQPTHLLENPEKYITKVGRILRKTSLDELPQLVNIAKGEMSAVGPRPALWNQEDLILLRELYGVHQIKPGLTGYAQITGRDELSIEDKAYKDYCYLKNLGIVWDILCFFGTFRAVIREDGVQEGRARDAKEKNDIIINTGKRR